MTRQIVAWSNGYHLFHAFRLNVAILTPFCESLPREQEITLCEKYSSR